MMTAILSDLNDAAKAIQTDAEHMILNAKNMKDITSHPVNGADELRQMNYFVHRMRAALNHAEELLEDMEEALRFENDWQEELGNEDANTHRS